MSDEIVITYPVLGTVDSETGIVGFNDDLTTAGRMIPGLRMGQTAVSTGDGTALVIGECYVTGQHFMFYVDITGLKRWLKDEVPLKEALPKCSDVEREFLSKGRGLPPENYLEYHRYARGG